MDLCRVVRTRMSGIEISDSGGGQATFSIEARTSIFSAAVMAAQQQLRPATPRKTVDLKVEFLIIPVSGEKSDWWAWSRVHHAQTRSLRCDEAFGAPAEDAIKQSGLAGLDILGVDPAKTFIVQTWRGDPSSASARACHLRQWSGCNHPVRHGNSCAPTTKQSDRANNNGFSAS